MLDLNITLVFQLVNFFIALYVLNLLLIRPIREIIRKRKAVMDDMSGESESYEYQAEQRLSDYDNQLTRARQDAGQNREKAREAGAAEQASLVAEARPGNHCRDPSQPAGRSRCFPEGTARSGRHALRPAGRACAAWLVRRFCHCATRELGGFSGGLRTARVKNQEKPNQGGGL